MARKTQPLDVHQPWKDPEHGQKTTAASQTYKQEEVSGGVLPEPVFNRIQGGDGHDTQQKRPKKYYFWKNWKARHWDKWETIEKFTFWVAVATITAPLVDIYQSYVMRETLVASQRPAVYLGLPDGKIADFVFQEGKETIALYFRNYGQSTARNAIIETWPVIGDPTSGSVSGVKIPPPQRERQGPDLPPGFPYIRYQPSLSVTKEELAIGKKVLTIIGRIQYADSFREYCDAFSIRYARETLPQFAFVWGRYMGSMDLCGKDIAVVSFVTVTEEDKDLFTQDPYDRKIK